MPLLMAGDATLIIITEVGLLAAVKTTLKELLIITKPTLVNTPPAVRADPTSNRQMQINPQIKLKLDSAIQVGLKKAFKLDKLGMYAAVALVLCVLQIAVVVHHGGNNEILTN
jgi:hypothetical protein